MKKLINCIFILLISCFMFFLSSCSISYHCKRCPIQEKDSTVTIIKDSIVETIDTAYVVDSTSMKLLIRCDSLGNAYIDQISYLQSNPKIKLKYKYIDNKISINCEIDSLEIYSRFKTRFRYEYKSETKVIEKPPEKFIPKFFIWALIISLLANISGLAWLFLKSKFL